VRLTVRDMSDEVTFPTTEVITSMDGALRALPILLERLAADFDKVNWGPKGLGTADRP
jgi:hypothetical protein